MRNSGIIAKYFDFLPNEDQRYTVTLGEGATPLIRLNRLERMIGRGIELYAKFEGMNPTGSFKDRGMTVAVSKAREEGMHAVLCASTGNTSASASAYAARAGMQCFVLIPEGKIAMGKLAQALMHGAHVIQIPGSFDDGMQAVKKIANQLPIALVNSVNPYRIPGQKTAAYEIVDCLGEAPDYHCLPVGNAANISAYWQGYNTYRTTGHNSRLPKMVGYQSEGAAPFIVGEPIESPETLATAIRIGNPQSWDLAWEAQESSGGWFAALPDSAILAAQRLLAAEEGIFCEPASAAALAGLLRDIAEEEIEPESQVVCTLTGHGLKDPQIVIDYCQDALLAAPDSLEGITHLIEEKLRV